jgi:hypothetical protein
MDSTSACQPAKQRKEKRGLRGDIYQVNEKVPVKDAHDKSLCPKEQEQISLVKALPDDLNHASHLNHSVLMTAPQRSQWPYPLRP